MHEAVGHKYGNFFSFSQGKVLSRLYVPITFFSSRLLWEAYWGTERVNVFLIWPPEGLASDEYSVYHDIASYESA
jgi:hypothetical protein